MYDWYLVLFFICLMVRVIWPVLLKIYFINLTPISNGVVRENIPSNVKYLGIPPSPRPLSTSSYKPFRDPHCLYSCQRSFSFLMILKRIYIKYYLSFSIYIYISYEYQNISKSTNKTKNYRAYSQIHFKWPILAQPKEVREDIKTDKFRFSLVCKTSRPQH